MVQREPAWEQCGCCDCVLHEYEGYTDENTHMGISFSEISTGATDHFLLQITYILDLLLTLHVLWFAKPPPHSSSVKRNDGSYTAICNKQHDLYVSFLDFDKKKSSCIQNPTKAAHFTVVQFVREVDSS